MQKFLGLCGLSSLLLSGASFAAENRGSIEDAENLVASFIEYYEKNGYDAAMAACVEPAGQFVDRDLYVFVLGIEDGMIHCHGAKPSLGGIAALHSDNPVLVSSATAVIDYSVQNYAGLVTYENTDPITGEVTAKVSYVSMLGDDMMLGVGVHAE